SGRLDVAAAVATTGSAGGGGGGGGATTTPPGSSPATTARTRTSSAPRTGGTANTPSTTGLDLVTPAPNALSADVPPAAVTTTTAPRGQVAAAHIGTDDDNSVSG